MAEPRQESRTVFVRCLSGLWTLDIGPRTSWNAGCGQGRRTYLEGLLKLSPSRLYRTQTLTATEVGQLLGFGNRWELEAFLSRNDVRLDYTETDLVEDVKTIRSAQDR